jgi:hypothetical protein
MRPPERVIACQLSAPPGQIARRRSSASLLGGGRPADPQLFDPWWRDLLSIAALNLNLVPHPLLHARQTPSVHDNAAEFSERDLTAPP